MPRANKRHPTVLLTVWVCECYCFLWDFTESGMNVGSWTLRDLFMIRQTVALQGSMMILQDFV